MEAHDWTPIRLFHIGLARPVPVPNYLRFFAYKNFDSVECVGLAKPAPFDGLNLLHQVIRLLVSIDEPIAVADQQVVNLPARFF